MSLQTRRRANPREWNAYVNGEARKVWPADASLLDVEVRLTLVHLAGDDPVDIDNIIKPIQDALVGVVYADDEAVCDVDSPLIRHLTTR